MADVILKRVIPLKKVITLIISCIAIIVTKADSWTDEHGNVWVYEPESGGVRITSCDFSAYSAHVPSRIGDMDVKSIGTGAFRNNLGIRELVIPDQITTLGQAVFAGCTNLETVTLGNGITTLTGVVYGSSMNGMYMDDDYYGVLPSPSLQGSHDNALFYNCTSLKTIQFGCNVADIGNVVFYNCSSLESVTIPDSVTNIGCHAFFGCNSLRSVSIGDGVSEIGRMAFRFLPKLQNVKLGVNVATIGDMAFKGCASLEEVVLPTSLRQIKFQAFADTGLTSIAIPTNRDGDETVLGQAVFANCANLEEVSFGDTLKSLTGVVIGDNINGKYMDCDYYNNETSTSLQGSYYNAMFYNCTSLRTINWGSGLREIGNIAFHKCTALAEVVIPANVTSIGNHAFFDCSSLRTVTINGNLDFIGRYAFSNCICLHYVNYLGKSVTTSPGYMPFKFNKPRVTIYVSDDSTGWTGVQDETGLPEGNVWCGTAIAYGPPPEITAYTVHFVPRNGISEVSTRIVYEDDPVGALPVLPSPSDGWDFTGWFTASAGGTKISADTEVLSNATFYAHWNGSSTFTDDEGHVWSYQLNSLDDGVSLIASSDTRELQGDIAIPSYICGLPVTVIGSWAFDACTKITGVTIPDTVRTISDGAFMNCTGIEHVHFGANVQSIGALGFGNCASIKSVSLPDSLEYLDKVSSFFRCSALRRFRIGNGMRALMGDAMEYVEGMPISGKFASVQMSPLGSCFELETLELGANVTSVDEAVCYNSTKLKRVICDGPLPKCNALIISGGNSERYCYVRRAVYPDGLPQTSWAGFTLRYLDDYALPELKEGATPEDIDIAVNAVNFADADGIKTAVGGDVEEYNRFRLWAQSLPAGEIAAVVSTNAAVSYMLGAEDVFVNTPMIKFCDVEIVDNDAAQCRAMSVNVVVRDGERAVAVAADRLKEMFEATGNVRDWDGPDKMIPVVTVEGIDGKNIRFRVAVGGDSDDMAFVRLRVR